MSNDKMRRWGSLNTYLGESIFEMKVKELSKKCVWSRPLCGPCWINCILDQKKWSIQIWQRTPPPPPICCTSSNEREVLTSYHGIRFKITPIVSYLMLNTNMLLFTLQKFKPNIQSITYWSYIDYPRGKKFEFRFFHS